MTTPRDPDLETRRRPARSVETFDERGLRTSNTMSVALLVLLVVLALIAVFAIVSTMAQ